MRKLTLAICTSLAVLGVVGLTAQGAFAKSDPGCGGKNDPYGTYPKGVYNSAWQKDRLDLVSAHSGTASEGKANMVDGFHGVVNFCGTNSDPPKSFVSQGTVSTPGQGEVVRCANPNKATGAAKAYCASRGGHLPNGTFTGWGVNDDYSDPLGLQFDDMGLQITTQPQGKSVYPDAGSAVQTHCNKINGKNTSSITIACQRGEADLILAKCGADIIWTLGPKVGGKYPLKMTIYQPTCSIDFTMPLYIDGIDSYEVCGYGLPKAPATNKCGTPTANKTLWVGKNGNAGTWGGYGTTNPKGYEVIVTMTDKSSVTAKTTLPVKWTP